MPALKLVFAAAVLAIGAAGGGLALRLQGPGGRGVAMSLGSALAGGVFLGAGLIHLLPDAASGLAAAPPASGYPWAFALCGAAFAAILLVEKVLWRPPQGPEGEPAPAAASPYLLAGVLGFHSLLAGLALGAEASLAGSVALFAAVAAHKGSAAFSLGVGLVRGGLPARRRLGILAAFCLSTPAGILAGAGVARLLAGQAARTGEAVFDSLAAGTFLYIAVMDVIQEEFAGGGAGVWKFAFLLAGLAGMAVLAVWA
jgi:zinc transporter 1/2/3